MLILGPWLLVVLNLCFVCVARLWRGDRPVTGKTVEILTESYFTLLDKVKFNDFIKVFL